MVMRSDVAYNLKLLNTTALEVAAVGVVVSQIKLDEPFQTFLMEIVHMMR